MANSLDELHPRAALVMIACDFHARGWMAGTAGNLSAREDDNHFWITASGKPKGRLDERDFLLVRVADGDVVERLRAEDKPSAETTIHAALYRLFPDARACLHGHIRRGLASPPTARSRARRTCGCRRLRCLRASTSGSKIPKWICRCLKIPSMSLKLRTRSKSASAKPSPPPLTALMIRAHGPTVWGKSVQEAYNRFEILEFLLRYAAAR